MSNDPQTSAWKRMFTFKRWEKRTIAALVACVVYVFLLAFCASPIITRIGLLLLVAMVTTISLIAFFRTYEK